MLTRLVQKTQTMTGVTGDTYTDEISMDNISTISVQSVIDVNTPAPFDFVDADVSVANNTITETAHGLPTGLKGQLTTTGVLPGGLSLATDYFVIVVDVDTIKLATTLANALAGTAVDITSAAGGGTHTWTSTAIAGATISYQMTNKTDSSDTASDVATDWTDIEDATAITADATNWYRKVGPEWNWFRIKATLTAGSMTIVNYVSGRGDDND